jgi:uncharacterized RDD family membrane protein YckC
MGVSLTPNPVRHPRRFGFILFNAICLVLLVVWLGLRSTSVDDGIAGLPNLALTTGGIVVLLLVWAGAWVAWGVMVWNRRRLLSQRTES